MLAASCIEYLSNLAICVSSPPFRSYGYNSLVIACDVRCGGVCRSAMINNVYHRNNVVFVVCSLGLLLAIVCKCIEVKL